MKKKLNRIRRIISSCFGGPNSAEILGFGDFGMEISKIVVVARIRPPVLLLYVICFVSRTVVLSYIIVLF